MIMPVIPYDANHLMTSSTTSTFMESKFTFMGLTILPFETKNNKFSFGGKRRAKKWNKFRFSSGRQQA